MGASTRIALAGIPASQKQSANFLAYYAAAVHPEYSQKTTPLPNTKVLADDSQDLVEVAISPYCQAKLTKFSEFLTNNAKQLPFFVRKATIGKVFARSKTHRLVLRPKVVAFYTADGYPRWRKIAVQLWCLVTS
jgi:hypothetical protein